MIFLGHLGISVVAGQLYNEVRRERLNLVWLAVLAMGPDIIDKPLALLFPESFGYHTRLGGHSLLGFAGVAIIISVIGRRRSLKFGHSALYSAVWLGHLLCDGLWMHDREYFFWPFLGTPAARDPIAIRRFFDGGLHPSTWAMEGAGLILLLFFYWRQSQRPPRPR